MSDWTRHVRPGESLKIPAAGYNAFVEAAKRDLIRIGTQVDPRRAGQRHLILFGKNDGATVIERHNVVEIGDPIVDPDNYADGFIETPTVSVSPPSAVGVPIGIAIEPIPVGAFGRILVSGVVPALVDVGADDDAVEIDPGSGILIGSSSGSVRIVSRNSGAGSRLALISLPPTAPGETEISYPPMTDLPLHVSAEVFPVQGLTVGYVSVPDYNLMESDSLGRVRVVDDGSVYSSIDLEYINSQSPSIPFGISNLVACEEEPGSAGLYYYGYSGVKFSKLHLENTEEESNSIVGGDDLAGEVEVSGDKEAVYFAGLSASIRGSTGNDAAYTVESSAHDAGVTTVKLDRPLPSNILDGSLVVDPLYILPTLDTDSAPEWTASAIRLSADIVFSGDETLDIFEGARIPWRGTKIDIMHTHYVVSGVSYDAGDDETTVSGTAPGEYSCEMTAGGQVTIVGYDFTGTDDDYFGGSLLPGDMMYIYDSLGGLNDGLFEIDTITWDPVGLESVIQLNGTTGWIGDAGNAMSATFLRYPSAAASVIRWGGANVGDMPSQTENGDRKYIPFPIPSLGQFSYPSGNRSRALKVNRTTNLFIHASRTPTSWIPRGSLRTTWGGGDTMVFHYRSINGDLFRGEVELLPGQSLGPTGTGGTVIIGGAQKPFWQVVQRNIGPGVWGYTIRSYWLYALEDGSVNIYPQCSAESVPS